MLNAKVSVGLLVLGTSVGELLTGILELGTSVGELLTGLLELGTSVGELLTMLLELGAGVGELLTNAPVGAGACDPHEPILAASAGSNGHRVVAFSMLLTGGLGALASPQSGLIHPLAMASALAVTRYESGTGRLSTTLG